MPLHDTKIFLWCAMNVSRIFRSLLFWDHQFTPTCNTFWHFWTPVRFLQNLCLLSAKQCKSSHCKQYYALLTQCFWWQNNKQGTVASLFTRPEHGDFTCREFWGTTRIVMIFELKTIWKKNHSEYSVLNFNNRNFFVQWTTCCWIICVGASQGNRFQHLP